MKSLGLVLIVLGIVALAYGGFTFKREKTVLDVGPIEAKTTEKHRVPLSPIVGGAAVLSGLMLVFLSRRHAAS